jgi:hypothetical protein
MNTWNICIFSLSIPTVGTILKYCLATFGIKGLMNQNTRRGFQMGPWWMAGPDLQMNKGRIVHKWLVVIHECITCF